MDILEELKERKNKQNLDFSIHTFGYGHEHDSDLMTRISNLGDGNFYFVEKLDTVDQTFMDCLGGLLTSVAKNVEISILPAGNSNSIMKAYGDESMWDTNADGYATTIKNLIGGRDKDYVLEIKVG